MLKKKKNLAHNLRCVIKAMDLNCLRERGGMSIASLQHKQTHYLPNVSHFIVLPWSNLTRIKVTAPLNMLGTLCVICVCTMVWCKCLSYLHAIYSTPVVFHSATAELGCSMCYCIEDLCKVGGYGLSGSRWGWGGSSQECAENVWTAAMWYFHSNDYSYNSIWSSRRTS